MSFRKPLILGLLVVAAILLLTRTFAKPGSADAPEAAPRPGREDSRPAPPSRWDAASGPQPAAHRERKEEEGEAEEDSVAASAHDAHASIRQYKTLTRYPTSSRRLTKESTDLLNPNKRHERRRPVPDPDGNPEGAWEVLHTADRYFVRGDEQAVVSLALWHHGEPVLPTSIAMVAQRPGAPDTEKVALSIERVDDQLLAELTPNAYWPDHIGELRVTTTFAAPGLREQTGSLSFYFTAADRAPAEFTGRFRDEASDGDLLIDVGIEVRVHGTYRIEGNLFDRDNQPIGWARFDGELVPGASSASLFFHGLIFHDADAQAPFVLRQVRGYRLRPGVSPHREDVPTYNGEYQTSGAYVLSDFAEEEYDSPRKQQMLELYQDALDRGVALTKPDFVGAGHQP